MNLTERIENDIYYLDVRVGFEECDTSLRMKVADFLKHIISTAGYHYYYRGVSHKMMYDNGQIFILSRMSIKIDALPCYNDKITVQTWEKGPQSVFAVRGFEVTDEKGKRLCSAVSNWLLIDPHTRGILRPTAFDLCDYRPVDKEPDCPQCEKIKPDSECSLIDVRKVRPSDTDANGHLHSAYYAYFITDALNDDKIPTEISINFIKEAKPGDELKIYAKEDGNTVSLTAMNLDNTCFTAKLTY